MKVGIEAISLYIPKLYLPIRELAIKREIDPDKLELGLGLKKMAVLDADEDTATMAAEALLKLIVNNSIDPKTIGRIYLGTESSLDGAKPTATYAMQLVEMVLEEKYGERFFKNVDVVDLTFACIGGVDALHNSLDYVRVNPDKQAIVIAADYAKYALDSTGEYTQGAGAVAMLISANPNLLEIENKWGVATNSVFDFFKPRQIINNKEILNLLGTTKDEIELFSDEPVFDGQYSNECYKDRVREAYYDYKEKYEANNSIKLYENWRYIAFHLPYAFQGKRMFSDVFALENGEENSQENLKIISKSEDYKKLVKEKIEPTQYASSAIGNMYTASIFTALIAGLEHSYNNNEDLTNQKIGFISYGSGSKSKVFEGVVNKNWKEVVEKIQLSSILDDRKEISYEDYINLHNKSIKEPLEARIGFSLQKIENNRENLNGARYYTYKI